MMYLCVLLSIAGMTGERGSSAIHTVLLGSGWTAGCSWHGVRHTQCCWLVQRQVMRVDAMEAFADERDREVRNILQSINDLGQIMKDLSVLVIDQGTILDRIDYNMDQVNMMGTRRLAISINTT